MALDFSGLDADIFREILRILGDQCPEIALLHVAESAPDRFMRKNAGDFESNHDLDRLEAYSESLRAAGFAISTQGLSAGRGQG